MATVYAGATAASYFDMPSNDGVGMSRLPDLVGIAHVGTVRTGGTGKIAEHAVANPDDPAVPLLVSALSTPPSVQNQSVETTQIAPTILHLLGLSPDALRAVQIEHTAVSP